MHFTKHRAVALFSVLALAACSGKDGTVGPKGEDGAAGAAGATGATGATGANGKDLTAVAQPESCEICHATAGAQHQAIYNSYLDGIDQTKTKMKVDTVAFSSGDNGDGTFTPTVTFKLYKGKDATGAWLAYNDITTTTNKDTGLVSGLAGLKQKTFYFVTQDASGAFVTPPDATSIVNFSFGAWERTGDGAYKGYVVASGAKVKFAADPLAAATNAFLYGYFGDANLPIPANTNGGRHYALMDNMVSFATTLKGAVTYTSTANVAGCEKCHGKPYSKHGYRQATVTGLPDFVACKACHTSSRPGSDHDWQWMADDPAAYAAGTMTKDKYVYVANVMNDTHMSHAMEFEYPQSMANCATCHAGKLDKILTDANFTITTCKSCHPVSATGTETLALNGTTKVSFLRAPSLTSLLKAAPLDQIHTMSSLYEPYTGPACNSCHNSVQKIGRVFSAIHSGINSQIYKSEGVKHSASISSAIDAAGTSFDAATNKLTVKFTMSGLASDALVKPTVVGSLYGYGTKDFLVSGHSSQTDGTTNMEWTEGAKQRSDPTKSSNSARLAVTPNATAGNSTWTAVFDLTLWAGKLTDGSVKRIEVGFLPVVGLDQTKAVDASTNPAIAVLGVTGTYDLVKKQLVADASSYGKNIVSTAKCNNCHDALGTTFHGPSYGSAGVVGCRLCHTVQTGGSHLEQQSRSIDSYVHAIHSFQAFDVATINFKDSVQELWYDLKIESEYPNFTLFSCESCHNPGMYEVPDQTKSLAAILSAGAKNTSWSARTIGAVPSVVVGPASKACGSCHRARMINENDAAKLAAFDSHTAAFSTQLPVDGTKTSTNDDATLDKAIKTIFSWFK